MSTAKFQIISRTAAQKTDQAWSWARSDEDFFAAGACHILAGVFLKTFPAAGFQALMIRPAEGFRCAHVIASNGVEVFDCRGWHRREDFLHRYAEACRALYPGWSYTLVAVDDPLSWNFYNAYTHRHASQFLHDPLPRAQAFLRKYPPPA